MTSRERVIRTLRHEPVDRAPRDLWVPHATEMLRGDEVQEMLFRYAPDLVKADIVWPRGERAGDWPVEAGRHTDAWGCTWLVPRRGAQGVLVGHPLANPAAMARYRPPVELLEGLDLDRVNRSAAGTSRFVLASSTTRPFERLQLLRGPRAAMDDLDAGRPEIGRLLGLLHEFSCREMELWASSNVDGVVLADDWASREGLLVRAGLWRELFKPLYHDYCRILRGRDKFVFFRSRGQIEEILHDLVEIGVDAVRADFLSMNLDDLARRSRGRITFWGGIDHEPAFTCGKPEEVRAMVQEVRKALDFGHGGLIAHCEWGPNVPFKNVAALYEAWLEPVRM